jgi:rhodanese-related sulfurtransferase
MNHRFNKTFPILLLICLITGLAAIASASDVPKISTEELRAMLDRPDLIIIDVRIERDWKSSALKVKGAVWEDFLDVEAWAQRYPKDKTIVLYCD